MPVLFFRSTTALAGPNDELVIPNNATKVDWEVKLAIVMAKCALYAQGTGARLMSPDTPCTANDYSERRFQLERSGQWVKGKSADSFATWSVSGARASSFPNPGNWKMWLRVNGERRQTSSTTNMIFDVASLVAYISEFMTLLPGDLISTGRPAGVGLGMKPPRYLKPGDIVELGIEGTRSITAAGCVLLEKATILDRRLTTGSPNRESPRPRQGSDTTPQLYAELG